MSRTFWESYGRVRADRHEFDLLRRFPGCAHDVRPRPLPPGPQGRFAACRTAGGPRRVRTRADWSRGPVHPGAVRLVSPAVSSTREQVLPGAGRAVPCGPCDLSCRRARPGRASLSMRASESGFPDRHARIDAAGGPSAHFVSALRCRCSAALPACRGPRRPRRRPRPRSHSHHHDGQVRTVSHDRGLLIPGNRYQKAAITRKNPMAVLVTPPAIQAQARQRSSRP
jgi:hypothetical protein